METIELVIGRDDVLAEVDKATDYTGSKMDGEDGEVRDRIAMTEEDMENLQRFWEESASLANERLKGMWVSGSRPDDAGDYRVKLEVSRNFDKGLTPSVESSLRSYFIQSIVGRWFRFVNKQETGDCAAEAGAMIEDVLRKLYSRRRPVSPRRR